MPTTTAADAEETKPQQTDDAEDGGGLPDKYKDIPFDDSRIVKYGETPGWEVLRRKADPIPAVDEDVKALIAEMSDLMYRAHGVGLAAPQIGRSVRLIVYDAGEGLKALLNPEVVKSKGEQFEPEEGCLSIPGLRGRVRRAMDVTVKAMDTAGRPIQFRAREFEARVLQHEIDHLNGVLFIDLADPDSLHMLPPDEDRGETGSAPPRE